MRIEEYVETKRALEAGGVSVAFQYRPTEITRYSRGHRVTVITLETVCVINRTIAGYAVFAPGDAFNLERGNAIAFARAYRQYSK